MTHRIEGDYKGYFLITSASGVRGEPWEAQFSIWQLKGNQYHEIRQDNAGFFAAQTDAFEAAEVAGRKAIDELIAT